MSQPRKTMKSDLLMHGLSSTIPGEIVEDILFRLPVKSLLRFKCVSKPWYSLLSSKNFVKTHLEKSANNINLAYPEFFEDSDQPNHAYCSLNLCSLRSLFHETDGAESVVHGFDDSLTFYTSPRTNVVGYANGLCCIREDAEKFILWNPATKKSQKLPLVYEEEFLWIDGAIRGFGFDESTDDYKVLAVVRTHPPGSGCCSFKFIFRLYSLRKNSWKTLESFLVFGAFEGSGVLVSGKFHWAARARARNDSGIRLHIVSFDLGSESVGSVEQPTSVDGYHLSPALSVLGGCLSVLCGNQRNGTDIWVMKEYGVTESWCKLTTVDHGTYGSPYYQIFTPLCISPEGEVLLIQGSSLMIYDPKENSFRTPGMDIKLPPYNDVGFYCESLVSPLPDNE